MKIALGVGTHHSGHVLESVAMESKVETIFARAIEIESDIARAAYLEAACDNDQVLRNDVESLLEAYARGGFLESPASGLEATLDISTAEKSGTQIGPYKLREQIGEGGMGTVFVAEQEKPLRRKVALKLIKPGMDTKSVIARFEAERQALAMMDHPSIAKVLDAGTTESGRPYFAMELVKGVPITDYCDTNQLTISERLDLFVQVSHAIQHAHQKGIIHRDIKPSNVLVTLHDGEPVPKVIDFGVAKAHQHASNGQYDLHSALAGCRNTTLYESGAGRDERFRCRYAERRLFAWSTTVRVIDRYDAL